MIPPDLRGRAHINLLEFITQVVGVWIAVEEKRLHPLDCMLAMGDSTTALGWMRRANFRERDENSTDWLAKQMVARKLGEIVLSADVLLYKQWFKGKHNVVADSLSRDLYYLSPQSHQRFLTISTTQQIPANFRIPPLPDKICCFITSVLQQMPVQERRLIQPGPSELARGSTGSLSYIASDLRMQSTWTDLTPSKRTLQCPPLPKQCEKEPTLGEIVSTWWREQSTPPSHMWHRPLGQTTGLTPDWTAMGNHVSC